MSILIVGMLDEREEALKLIKEQVQRNGYKPLLLDISVGNGGIVPKLKADVTCSELVELAKSTAEAEGKPISKKATATSVMARGLNLKVSSLQKAGEIQGIIAITGMTGALISLEGMKVIPFGTPKVLVSSAVGVPAHAGQLSNYLAIKDITVLHAVVDTVGMNALVKTLAVNGVNALCGMIQGAVALRSEKPSVGITEFGFCDKGAHYIREMLEHEYEIVSFHATGFGDKAAMDLVPQGVFRAFIDLVPGAFSEYLLGGNRGTPGPDRLDVALGVQIPYILCPGGFDIISCGPMERKDKNDPLWTSRKLIERKLHIQDPPRVQARMNPEEAAHVATAVAEKLNRYSPKSRVRVVIPLRGFSNLSTEGTVLHDPAADRAFIDTLKKYIDPAIGLTEVDSDINSRPFAAAVSKALLQALSDAPREQRVN